MKRTTFLSPLLAGALLAGLAAAVVLPASAQSSPSGQQATHAPPAHKTKPTQRQSQAVPPSARPRPPAQAQPPKHPPPLDRAGQQRIRDARAREQRLRELRRQQATVAAERARQLERQRRFAQHRYEQQYDRRLREHQSRWDRRRYNPYHDPFFWTPPSYRYVYDGRYYLTNRYGADLMRQAVNYGYEEGFRAGVADREDRWRGDYRDNYAYMDARYGYYGYYLDEAQYRYYFREGFRRGYEDGYYGHHHYGHRNDEGVYVVIATVLAVILGLHALH